MSDTNIVICYDGSDASREAIERTAVLHSGADVSILSVWQPMQAFVMSWGLMAGDLGDMDEESRNAAGRLAQEGAGVARAAGLQLCEHVEQAPISVARTILDWCDANQPVMVVVGATGRSAIGDVITGSVANAIIHHASMPVLVVRLPHGGHREDARTHATGVASPT